MKQEVCKFYMSNCCKKGNNCKFAHPLRKKSGLQPERPDPREPIPYAGEVKVSPEKEEAELPPIDADTSRQIQYLRGMIDSLKKKCMECKEQKHLVTISCSCRVMCLGCAQKVKQCPIHESPYDHSLFI